ncbi:MAG: hypothetical protein AAGA60_19620 [Cyanobacteria bacterium P01_E01_bin.42]
MRRPRRSSIASDLNIFDERSRNSLFESASTHPSSNDARKKVPIEEKKLPIEEKAIALIL